MAPATSIQWRASGMREVDIDGETHHQYTVKASVPLKFKVLLPKGAKLLSSSTKTKRKCKKSKPEMVKLHVFNKAAKLWHDEYKRKELDFLILEMNVKATAADLIEKVVSRDRGGGLRGWAVTEVFKAGGGEWHKGTTIAHASDKADDRLSSFGWNSSRGCDLPPVWVCVHAVR